MLNKFKMLCEQIKTEVSKDCVITGCDDADGGDGDNIKVINSLVDNDIVYVGCWFAPKEPFKITEDMFPEGESICLFKDEDTYAGRIDKIVNDRELILSVSGNYRDRLIPTFDEKVPLAYQGYSAIRCRSFKIKYTLKDGEQFFTSDKVEPYGTKWLEVFYKNNVKDVLVEQQSSPDIKKYKIIADQIGGEYIPETNTIDCKGNKVKFKDDWLDENGTFDFKLINVSNEWGGMFASCYKLKYLPNSFTIPNGVTHLNSMFCNCCDLVKLPDQFIIPETVVSCYEMFLDCKSLIKLPNSFTVPNSVIYYQGMFCCCHSLTHLPDNFKLGISAENVEGMFSDCWSLVRLPKCFTIPDSVIDCNYMFCNCRSLIKLPDDFAIGYNVKDCSGLFDGCESLVCIPEGFTIPDGAEYFDYMFMECKSLHKLPTLFHIPNLIQCDHIFTGSSIENQDIESYTVFDL